MGVKARVSKLRNLLGSYRYLLSVRKRLAALGDPATEAGCLSRFGALRRALSLRRTAALPSILPARSTLVDFNERKLHAAREIWPGVTLFDPYGLQPRVSERFLILVAVLLPKALFQTLQVLTLGQTAAAHMPNGTEVKIWNPYSIFHHALAEQMGVNEIFLLAPFYPAPRGAHSYIGSNVCREVLNLSPEQFRITSPSVQVISDEVCIAFYPTKLDFDSRDEEKLLQVALDLIGRTSVRIFLHPSDSVNSTWSRIPDRLRSACTMLPSLDNVSSNQVGVSSVSTVGLHLASAGIRHYFLLGLDQPQGAVARSSFPQWVVESNLLLDGDRPVAELSTQLLSMLP